MTVPQNLSNRKLPAGLAETSPLMVGIVGISIPVSLIIAAAVGGSVVVLVFAVLAMLVVGAATLGFVLYLASDGGEQLDGGGVPTGE
jgi:hypothetical protein